MIGNELNEIKYDIKSPKILQKITFLSFFYVTETCKVSKFLLLLNLDCQFSIYTM